MAEKLEHDHAALELAEQESRFRRIIRIAGPGLITGGADNDPSGIATYSVVGATTGFSQLWLLVISMPLLIAVQGIAARLGNVTKLGLADFIAYFIGISTASTLFLHHKSIQTAADAAKALTPFAGNLATVVFSIGILGAGLMAIPVLAVSTGYVVAGTLGWRMGLGREAYTAPGFYSVIALSLLAGVQLAISGFSPIKALFYSQILDGLVAPVLIALMVILASRSRVMGAFTATRWERLGGWSAFVIMALADIALIYSLITGSSA